MEIRGAIGRILAKAMRIWTMPVLRYGIKDDDQFHVELFPDIEDAQGIDERIAQIDDARAKLSSALVAIDELKVTAERNKAELSAALAQIETARAEKVAAEKELSAVKQIAESDVAVFRRMAGVPSRSQIAKERFVGFLLGILASVVATGLWWFGGLLVAHFGA